MPKAPSTSMYLSFVFSVCQADRKTRRESVKNRYNGQSILEGPLELNNFKIYLLSEAQVESTWM